MWPPLYYYGGKKMRRLIIYVFIYVIRLTMEIPVFVIWLVATLLLGASNGFRVPLVHRNSTFPADLRGPLSGLVKGSILANISFGKPPVPQLLVMDTGSELTWIRCRSCGSRICTYDPTKSSTFTPLYKNFTISYIDGLSVKGTLGLETLTFRTFENDIVEEIGNSVFGCADTIQNDNMELASGLLGLRADVSSIFSQWNDFSRFSYCIGDLNDKDYKSSVLILGDEAVIEGDTIEMINSEYEVKLDGISIGGKAIGDKMDRLITIDSGTTISYITRDLLSPLMEAVSQALKGWRVVSYYDRLCYAGDISSIKNFNFPSIKLSLGGVDRVIEIEVEGAFIQDYNQFCLAFEEAEVDEEKHRPINVLGLLAQQNYNIGFDLKAMTVSIDRMDCKSLEG